MSLFLRDHIKVNNRTEVLAYTSNVLGRTKIKPRRGLNRQEHGDSLKEQFETAVESFRPDNDNEFVYLVFKSPLNFLIDLEKLDKNECELCTYKKSITEVGNDQEAVFYEAIVKLNKAAISIFLRKIDEFINENTKAGNPLNQPLIANIDEIRHATLESFWQEIDIPFPGPDDITWWEVWLNVNENEVDPLAPYREFLNRANIQLNNKVLKFPEHRIYLMRGSANQLGISLLYTDRLGEIRKPKETAEFFTYLEKAEQNQWIDDLNNRIVNNSGANSISICILDTGLNRSHPLLVNLVEERNLDTLKPLWTNADNSPSGHGTGMGGLALFGDLTTVLASNDPVQIDYHLESVKLIEGRDPHNPTAYGAVTQEAIARAEVLNNGFKRQICMAITSEEFVHLGRPSSWSAAIDQALFGSLDDRNSNVLLFVSAGNIPLEEIINYPLSNDDQSIHDPAQSFNSITVGAYTIKDTIDLNAFPGATLLCNSGSMCGSNSTSITWNSEWCRKPDIVMEGGNYGVQDNALIFPDSLKLLTTSKGGVGKSWLTTLGDTSAATALASKFSAELYSHYPNYWPETIRALIIHSANWTTEMLGLPNISDLTLSQKEKLVSRVGYGIPNMEKAKYSANDSLSLIVERSIQPYKLESSTVKTNEFHLFTLPWPAEVLEQLENVNVKFKITLSYFIEPNPGNKTYEKAASYRSHGLRFKMIDSNESIDVFKARVSKDMREGPYVAEGGEHWVLGPQIRDKGSIHKDIWEGAAVNLSTRNKIAIYPVGGWWKNRKKRERFTNSIRYSLIMTIESPVDDLALDIFTPVFNEISIEI